MIKCLLCDFYDFSKIEGVEDFEYKTYKPVTYLECKRCHLLQQFPLPKKERLSSFYPEDYRNYLPVKKNIFSFLKKIQMNGLVSKLSKHLDPKDKILELGSGNGGLLSALQTRGYFDLQGCDFGNIPLSNIRFRSADIENEIPFDEKFDVIIMNNVIEHLLDPIKVLSNCANKLTEKGIVIIITPNTESLDFKIFKKYWAGFHAPRHICLFSHLNIHRLFTGTLNGGNIEQLPDLAQWAISVQNILQSNKLTRSKLKNGLAWYFVLLMIILSPMILVQHVMGRSGSVMCVLKRG